MEANDGGREKLYVKNAGWSSGTHRFRRLRGRRTYGEFNAAPSEPATRSGKLSLPRPPVGRSEEGTGTGGDVRHRGGSGGGGGHDARAIIIIVHPITGRGRGRRRRRRRLRRRQRRRQRRQQQTSGSRNSVRARSPTAHSIRPPHAAARPTNPSPYLLRGHRRGNPVALLFIIIYPHT